MFMALSRNHGAALRRAAHTKAMTTIAKLTHLKSSPGPSAFAPPCSAANAAAAKTREEPHTKSEEKMDLPRFIGPLGRAAGRVLRFPKPAAPRWVRDLGGPERVRGRRVLWPRRLRQRTWRALLLAARRARRAVSCAPLLVRRTPGRAPGAALPDTA